ncbi:MAG: hypothetical protein VX550_04510, partial [Bacteroidota bacterium]|nr:hypothetical protein [Bacteroidota bacterium]
LLNLGFGLWILEISDYKWHNTYQNLIEVLSAKIGGFSIYLGVMLFINLFFFFRGRRKSKQSKTVVKTPIYLSPESK